jgi:hypothetical protein
MIGRRTAAAGIVTKLGNHSFRATGITRKSFGQSFWPVVP